MKLFVKNVNYVLPNIKGLVVPFEESTQIVRKEWIQQFNKSEFLNLSQARLKTYCKENKCSKVTTKNLGKTLSHICKADLQQVKNICSEIDSLYGISYAPEIYSLLVRSNALRLISPARYQLGCLKRFIQQNKKSEVLYRPYRALYSHLYSKHIKNGGGYEQGRLFIVGALKEFQEKGLKNIFKDYDLKKVKPNIVSSNNIKPKAGPKIEQIELPKFKQHKVKFKTKKKRVEKIVKTVESSFKQASLYRSKNDLDRMKLDMQQFQYDYTFTLEQNKQFAHIIKKFSSQASLKSMKRMDKLGQKVAPIPLRFLKFLIERDMHQGLFNLTIVLGSQFYVVNDIDAEGHIERVDLKNDKETNFKWQIYIITPEKA